jgi:hypothetical protein
MKFAVILMGEELLATDCQDYWPGEGFECHFPSFPNTRQRSFGRLPRQRGQVLVLIALYSKLHDQHLRDTISVMFRLGTR